MIRIAIPKQGYSGIHDGLLWKHLENTIGAPSPDVVLQVLWWWRSDFLPMNSSLYLWSRRDRGGNLPFTYEAVARLCGRYPYNWGGPPEEGDEQELIAAPFNLLSPQQAEVFAEIFRVSEDPRYAPAYVREDDPYTFYHMKTIEEGGSGIAEEINNAMVDCYRSYTQPVRFNLLTSRHELHMALDRFLDSIQHDPGKSKGDFPKAGIKMGFEALESWDLRRWSQDFSGNKSGLAKLKELPKEIWPTCPTPRINNPAVTRARRLAIDAVERAKAHVKAMDPIKRPTGAEKELVTFVKGIRFIHE